ncbi:DUF308 domain-containing protein [Culicoidibacter larvae]|uniref:DUF308 domain-containing protein n=1 Tax=Culicoidibacter larvae TaxID=2579976 RepID=A0A5R8QB43_9FIRM|nr:DUF308 domain-containing protein [Culicoidibacter larvae]TLG73801.1 hypothetical protein FEZ08_06615 [Culicoidibacter larvae]
MMGRIINALEALLFIAIGGLLLIFPIDLIEKFLYFGAIALLLFAVLAIIRAIKAVKPMLRIMFFIQAAVNVTAAILIFWDLNNLTLAMAINIILIWFVVYSGLQIVLALLQRQGWHIFTIVIDILLLILAIWAYFNFIHALATVVLIFGGIFIVLGIMHILNVFRGNDEKPQA